MSIQIKISQTGGYIHRAVSGVLKIEQSILLVQELTVAVIKHNLPNILVDARNADIQLSMQELIKTAVELGAFFSDMNFKIAVIIPRCTARLEDVERFKKCMEIQRLQYQHFFDYNAAIKWFSGKLE